MNKIYKVTAKSVEILTINIGFFLGNNKIIFNNGLSINTSYMNQILVNKDDGFVVFTENSKLLLSYQESIKKLLKKG